MHALYFPRNQYPPVSMGVQSDIPHLPVQWHNHLRGIQGTKLLDLQIVNTTRQHLYQYTLASEWKKGTDTAEEAVPAVENADGTKNYRAVVTATPTGSLKFTDEIMPKMLKVNVDGTHIKTVPITDAKLNDNGTMEVSYSFEKMFIGGSLRMDYATDYSKTCMRFGYDFKLPENAEFEGCEWYYGTAEDALNYTLLPQDKTNQKWIMNGVVAGAVK